MHLGNFSLFDPPGVPPTRFQATYRRSGTRFRGRCTNSREVDVFIGDLRAPQTRCTWCRRRLDSWSYVESPLDSAHGSTWRKCWDTWGPCGRPVTPATISFVGGLDTSVVLVAALPPPPPRSSCPHTTTTPGSPTPNRSAVAALGAAASSELAAPGDSLPPYRQAPPPFGPSPGLVSSLSTHSGHIESSSQATATMSYTASVGIAVDIAPQTAADRSVLLPPSAISRVNMDANTAVPIFHHSRLNPSLPWWRLHGPDLDVGSTSPNANSDSPQPQAVLMT